MVYGKLFLLNNEVVSDGITHKLVCLPQGICYGCAFDRDDGIQCEDLPQAAKELCIEKGAIWVAQ